MFNGLLPVGTVALLKNSTKRIMIIGVCQLAADDPTKVWDYVGCPFPEGYLGPDKTYLFNNEQIDKIYAVGYQDEEQFGDSTDSLLQDFLENGTSYERYYNVW